MKFGITTNLVVVALLVSFLTGCSTPRLMQTAKSRFAAIGKRQEIRSSQRISRNQARFDDLESRHETVPEVEADIEMRLRQRFEMGEPELDVDKAREVLNAAIQEHESRVNEYQTRLAVWEAQRNSFLLNNPNAFFNIPKPVKPNLAVMASEVPLKVSLRIGTKIDNTKVKDFRSREVVSRNRSQTPIPTYTSGLSTLQTSSYPAQSYVLNQPNIQTSGNTVLVPPASNETIVLNSQEATTSVAKSVVSNVSRVELGNSED